MRISLKFLALLCLLAPLSLLAGCVQTGDYWNHKVALASDLTPSALDGQWEGSWHSYQHYDTGLIHFTIIPADVAAPTATMPALSSPATPGTTRYLANVTLWHYGIFCPEYFSLVLTAQPGIDGQVRFRGERDLGPLDGACKFDGFVDTNKNTMSYVSRQDFGSITLHRVVNVH
jgi:hypothetical protein